MKLLTLLFLLAATCVSQVGVDSLINRGLALENQNKLTEAIAIYRELASRHTESSIVFRTLGNALCEQGFLSKNEDRQERLFREAISHAERAVSLDSADNQAHYTLARACGRLAQIVGIKEQMSLAARIKAEADKAIELNPKHDLAFHIIGLWNFRFAELSWIERTVANAIFGKIPKNATFANALRAFERAAQLDPNNIAHFYEKARTLIELDRDDEAKAALLEAARLTPRRAIDANYQKKAKALLADL